MARRLTMPIRSVHPDGTICDHKLTSVGKPTEDAAAAGCTGRSHFTATCSACADTITDRNKVTIKPAAAKHLDLHRHGARPAPAPRHRGRPIVDVELPVPPAGVSA